MMHRICLGCSVFMLTLCGCDTSPDELDELENLVLAEEETQEWSLPEDRSVATGELLSEEEAKSH